MTHYVVRANPVEDDRETHHVVRVNPVEEHHVVRVNPRIQAGSLTAVVQQYLAEELDKAQMLTPRTRFRETSKGGIHVTGIDPYMIARDGAVFSRMRRFAEKFGYDFQVGAGAILLTLHDDAGTHARMNPRTERGTRSPSGRPRLGTHGYYVFDPSRPAIYRSSQPIHGAGRVYSSLAVAQRAAARAGAPGAPVINIDPEFSAMANPRRRKNPTDAEIRERFDRCIIDVRARGGVYNEYAVCSASMRKAYGPQFQRIAAEGRSLAAAERHAHGMVRARATGRLERRAASRLRRTAVQRRGIAGRVAREQATARRRAMAGEREMMRAVANPRGAYNETNVEELLLFATNDEPTYRHAQAIMRNMVAKQRRGTYVPQLAVKAWVHWADGAAKRYAHEFATPSEWSKIFSPADRHEAAKRAVDYYAEEMRGLR